MDIPNFKDILSKLSIFKNKSILMPVIIGLVAVLLFIPTQLMSSGLKEKIQKDSISSYTRVKNLLKNSVPDELLEMKKKQLEKQANDANEVELLAKQTTQRQLLSYNIFDVNDPNDLVGLTFLQFGKQYYGGIDKMIADAKAGDCPTEAELTREIDKSGVKSRTRLGMSEMSESRNIMTRRPGGQMRGLMPGARGFQGGLRIMSELELAVIDQLCKKRAEEISFYVTPTQLSGYNFWKEYDINVKKAEAVEDCWYYQLAYWVIEDVFDTITATNNGHENTLSSPVKRLVRLGFSMDTSSSYFRGRGGLRGGGAVTNTNPESDDRPKYVISSDKQTMLSETCTGRYCNDDIDVIHFNLVCIVNTKDFMSFMKELCSAKEHQYIDESGQTHTYKHNQITIIETKVNSIDKDDPDSMYYVYGDEGVVELDLICEYIFKKDGYENLKPESVKDALFAAEEK